MPWDDYPLRCNLVRRVPVWRTCKRIIPVVLGPLMELCQTPLCPELREHRCLRMAISVLGDEMAVCAQPQFYCTCWLGTTCVAFRSIPLEGKVIHPSAFQWWTPHTNETWLKRMKFDFRQSRDVPDHLQP